MQRKTKWGSRRHCNDGNNGESALGRKGMGVNSTVTPSNKILITKHMGRKGMRVNSTVTPSNKFVITKYNHNRDNENIHNVHNSNYTVTLSGINANIIIHANKLNTLQRYNFVFNNTYTIKEDDRKGEDTRNSPPPRKCDATM